MNTPQHRYELGRDLSLNNMAHMLLTGGTLAHAPNDRVERCVDADPRTQ